MQLDAWLLMSARTDAARATAITARLSEILVAQGATNFLAGIRSIHALVDGPDPDLAGARRINAGMNGGMGSINDLVFWPDDPAQRVAVNEEWTALRDELWDVLARYR